MTKRDERRVKTVMGLMPVPSETDDYVSVLEAINHEVLALLEAYEIQTTGRSKLTQDW
jgi:hypothetical protein